MPLTSPHIGIYEPSAAGHRLKYVQYLITHAANKGATVTLFTTDAATESENYKLHLRSLEKTFEVQTIDNDNVAQIELLATCSKTDLMVVPDGDTFTWGHLWKHGWKGHGSVSVLVMRPCGQSKHFGRRYLTSTIKRLLFFTCVLRRRITILRLDSSIKGRQTSRFGAPDPISFEPDVATIAHLWPAPTVNYPIQWIGMVGALSQRKNLPLVLDAASDVQHEHLGIVVAGRVHADISHSVGDKIRHLKSKNVPVIVIDRALTDGELDAIIQRLHAVVLAHSNEGSSGILGKAVQAGTFIIAAGARSLKKDCQALPASSVWSPLAREYITKSIEQALSRESPAPRNLQTTRIFTERLMPGM